MGEDDCVYKRLIVSNCSLINTWRDTAYKERQRISIINRQPTEIYATIAQSLGLGVFSASIITKKGIIIGVRRTFDRQIPLYQLGVSSDIKYRASKRARLY